MKYGVILARFQPIHNGHLALIEKACSENDQVLILIGSADKLNNRNPIPFDIRLQLVQKAVEHLTNVKIVGLDDLSCETDNNVEWGFYLYSHIVSHINQANFTIYYSDGYEIITSWFPGFILRNNVSLSLLARNSFEKGISATAVRTYITNEEWSALETVVPANVFSYKERLREHIAIAAKYLKQEHFLYRFESCIVQHSCQDPFMKASEKHKCGGYYKSDSNYWDD